MHEEFNQNFWFGNVILVIALVMLLFMGSLWESLGVIAMVIWIAMVALGVYLLMSKTSA
ncbi:MAG: hypothetical protein WCX90_04555 [Thiohalomonadaceae bacterium]